MIRILQGDVRARLADVADESVQCAVTSPPYFGLRRYLPTDHADKAMELGSEPSPQQFVSNLVSVFRDLRRVLRRDGVLFVNLADSYAGSGKGPAGVNSKTIAGSHNPHSEGINSGVIWPGTRAKSLLLVPERFAIAMSDDGWIVRDQIAWVKRSCMPESVRDRFTRSWEPVYMFAREERYYWDQEAVRVDDCGHSSGNGFDGRQGGARDTAISGGVGRVSPWKPGAGANRRNNLILGPEPSNYDFCLGCSSFWSGSQRPKPRMIDGVRVLPCPACGVTDAWVDHYAAFPSTLVEPLIKAASRPGDTVLDPFLGSGTTALVADRLGRSAIGIELSERYAALAAARLRADAPMFAEVDAG